MKVPLSLIMIVVLVLSTIAAAALIENDIEIVQTADTTNIEEQQPVAAEDANVNLEPVIEVTAEEVVEETPAEEVPAEEVTEETPVEETPAEEVVEETPVEEEVPAEEVTEETQREEHNDEKKHY